MYWTHNHLVSQNKYNFIYFSFLVILIYLYIFYKPIPVPPPSSPSASCIFPPPHPHLLHKEGKASPGKSPQSVLLSSWHRIKVLPTPHPQCSSTYAEHGIYKKRMGSSKSLHALRLDPGPTATYCPSLTIVTFLHGVCFSPM